METWQLLKLDRCVRELDQVCVWINNQKERFGEGSAVVWVDCVTVARIVHYGLLWFQKSGHKVVTEL